MVCRVYRLFSAFEASDFSHALQMSLAALQLELMRLTLRRTVDNVKKEAATARQLRIATSLMAKTVQRGLSKACRFMPSPSVN